MAWVFNEQNLFCPKIKEIDTLTAAAVINWLKRKKEVMLVDDLQLQTEKRRQTRYTKKDHNINLTIYNLR